MQGITVWLLQQYMDNLIKWLNNNKLHVIYLSHHIWLYQPVINAPDVNDSMNNTPLKVDNKDKHIGVHITNNMSYI